MKIFFTGQRQGNAGPDNVNKDLVANFTSDFMILQNNGKLMKSVELVKKILQADVLVLSGLAKECVIGLKVARFFHKKSAYIMHGCAAYESKVNGDDPGRTIEDENYILENVDLILAVSKKFALWVQENYPQYKGKISYLYNGVNVPESVEEDATKEKRSIVAVGGNRETKNNLILDDVVHKMNGLVRLTVCGKIHGSFDRKNDELVRYTDLIPQSEFYDILKKSEIFIINSIFEPFSLSVMEALNCGCSILVSSYVGISDLLDLEDSDIIYDPMNKEEIQKKIEYLLENPNCSRILSGVDYNSLSYASAVEKLRNKCRGLIETA